MAIIILGDGGHARALKAALDLKNAILTRTNTTVKPGDVVHIGIGDIKKRRELYERFHEQVPYGGVQIMARVHIGPNCNIGRNVLLNTGCQVDHDCEIGDHCVISPGAILCGGVKLGEACSIGAGAIIVEGVDLEAETIVPAGTLVVGQTDMRRPVRVVWPN